MKSRGLGVQYLGLGAANFGRDPCRIESDVFHSVWFTSSVPAFVVGSSAFTGCSPPKSHIYFETSSSESSSVTKNPVKQVY